jgi:rRNA processing protein Gar1
MIVNSEDKNFQDVMGEGAKQAEPNSCYIVPLGKVLEVFGPVTHPLYTVRLKSFEKNESEQKEDDTTERKEEDPWSSNGALTKLINSQPKMCIYYSEDHAKMVDTQSVVRNSGKGCDASNVYDEEVQNAKEMYFSDDEQEREFKRKGKQKKNQRGRHNETNIGTSGGRFQRSPRGGGSNFHNVSYNHSQAPPPPQSWQQPIQQGQSYNHASQYNQGATPNNTFYHIPNTYGNQQYQVQPNQYQVQPNQYQAQPNQYQVQPNQYNPVQPPQQHFHHPPAHQYQNYPNSNVGYPVPPPPNQGNSNPVGQYQNNNPNRGDVQGDRGEEENDTVYYNYSGPS